MMACANAWTQTADSLSIKQIVLPDTVAMDSARTNTGTREVNLPTIEEISTETTAGFAPTMMQSLQVADPSSRINLIAPPTANRHGSANLAYELEMPPARNGMSPPISVQYSSDGGEGLLGEGWDLPIPAITVDTRWGVPRYDTSKETETYLIDGEMLAFSVSSGAALVPHRTEGINRIANRHFFRRRGGDFHRIIRKGSSMDSYYWEVTDANGTVYTYGGTANSRLTGTFTDAGGNSRRVTAEWRLSEIREIHGDRITFEYMADSAFAVPGGTIHAIDLYPKFIRAFNRGAMSPHTTVTLTYDSSKNINRTDARYGFLTVSRRLLTKATVNFLGSTLRSYVFSFSDGKFGKKLLSRITHRDQANATVSWQSFTYHDKVASGNYFKGAEDAESVSLYDAGLSAGFAVPSVGAAKNAPTALGGESTSSTGFGLYAGVGVMGTGIFKENTGGFQFDYNTDTTEGMETFVDINGDGLPDKVYRKDGTVSFCAATKNVDTLAYGDPIALMGIDGFLKTKSSTRTWGGQAVAGISSAAASVGISKMKSNSKTSCYLSDINGDGLPDLVRDGKVWFNHVEENANGVAVPSFTESSADTPSPIFHLRDINTGVVTEDSLQTDSLIMTSPLIDVVRVWEAPRNGTVDINGFSQLQQSNPSSGTADGVILTIEMHGDTLVRQQIAADDYQFHDFVIDSLHVTKGDRIYFRAQSGDVPDADGTDDEVWWPVFVEYQNTMGNPQTSPDESMRFSSCDGILNSDDSFISIIPSETLILGGKVSKWASMGDVTLAVIGRDSTGCVMDTLYSFTILRDSIYVGELAATIPNPHRLTSIRMELSSPAYSGLQSVGWHPTISYPDGHGGTIIDSCAVMYHTFSEELQHGEWWQMPTSARQYFVKPRLSTNRWPGKVTLTVKSNNGVHYQKTYHTEAELRADSTRVLFPSSYMWLRAEFTCEDTLTMADIDSAKVELNIASRNYHLTPDVFARKRTDVLGTMYRGWGAFCYNASQGRYALPIDTTLLYLPQDSASTDPLTMPFVRMRVNRSNHDLLESPNTSNSVSYSEYVSPGRLTEQSVRWVNPLAGGIVTGRDNPNGTGAAAVTQVSESNGIVVQAGVSPLTLNTSIGNARTRVTMMDMNGDGYPDIVTDGKVQYTSPLGGLSGEILDSDHGIESSSNGSSLGAGSIPVTSFSVNVRNLFKGRGAESNKALTIAGKASVSGSGNSSQDGTKTTFIDINGDGLPDAISKSGGVFLNMGYSFSPTPITIPADAMQGGTSTSTGLGGGFSICSGSISGGVSLSVGSNSTKHTLVDVNDDGLPDIVSANANGLTVQLNIGSGFGSPLVWANGVGIDSSTSTASSANVAGTVSIPAFAIRIVTNPSASVGKSVHRTTATLADIDGDGFVDALSSDNESSISVRRSTIGCTNKLKTVTNTLGGTFSIEYCQTSPSYGLPGGKWVMKSVVVDDGINDDGPLTRTEFAYSDGVRDRREREFLGFGEVLVKDMDTAGDSLYRQTAYRYDVAGGYHTCANLLSTSVMDAAGRKYVETENVYEAYAVTKIGAFYKTVAQGDATAMWTPLRYSRNLRYEGAPEGVVMSSDWYKYKEGMLTFGEMEKRRHRTGDGMSSDGTGSYDYETAYAYKTNLLGNYSSIPSSITTTGNDGTAHKVTALYGAPCPTDITQVRHFYNATHHADTDYERDSVGNVTKVILPDNGQGQRMWYSYTYDDTLRLHLVRVNDAHALQSSVDTLNLEYGIPLVTSDDNAKHAKMEIDGAGRILRVWSPKDWDVNSAVSAPYTVEYEYHPQATQYNGNISHPAYAIARNNDAQHPDDPITVVSFVDGFGRKLQEKRDAMVASGSNPTQASLVMVASGRGIYDSFGREVATYYPTTDTQANASTFKRTFDATNPTSTEYDILDRPVRVTLPDLSQTTYSYAMEGGLLKTVETNARGNSTATYTDGDGRMVLAVRRYGTAAPITTSYAYDALGRLASVTDAEGNVTSYGYDWMGQTLWVNHPASGTTSYMYAPAGNVLSKRTADMSLVDTALTYRYDYDWLTGVSHPLHTEEDVAYVYGERNANDNGKGRLTLRIDGSGAVAYRYDAQGMVSSEKRSVAVPGQGWLTFTTQYEYDSFGRLMSITYPDDEHVRYRYDRGGALDSVCGIKTHEYPYVTALRYDKFGNRTYARYGNGLDTYLTYDINRRLSRLRVNDGSNEVVNNVYGYDYVGNVTDITSTTTPRTVGARGGLVDHIYVYDPLNRLTNASGYFEGNGGREATYSLTMSYDDLWRVQSKNVALWQQGVMSPGPLSAGYSLGYSYGSATGTRFQLTDVSERAYRGAAYSPYGVPKDTLVHRYGYDANGNLLYESTGRKMPNGTINEKVRERKLLWDEENRLLAVDENGYVSNYVYDADGERVVKMHGGNRGLYVNSAGRDSLTETQPFTVYACPYLTYDSEDRYIKHVYMGGERVVSKIGNANDIDRFYNAERVLPDSTCNSIYGAMTDAIRQRYSYMGVPCGIVDGPAAMRQGAAQAPIHQVAYEGGQYYYTLDHLGSTTLITDTARAAVQHIEYLPYGEVFMEEDNDTWNTPFKFNGKEYDEETGLYYYGKRFYDPKYSIWYGTDPLQKKYPEFSTYCFTIGNPVNYIDFDGDSTIVNNVGYIIRQNGIDNGVYLQKDEQSVLNFLGEIGKEVDISEVYQNLLLLNSKVAKRMFNPWKFKKLVATNGEWDLKNNSKTIYGISNDSKTKLLFNGHVMDSQDVGNHHFGVMARSFGFPLYFALRAAGKYQITSGTSRKEWQVYRHDVIVSHSTGLSYRNSYMIQPYGDDPNDQRWIREGYKYFNVLQKWK